MSTFTLQGSKYFRKPAKRFQVRSEHGLVVCGNLSYNAACKYADIVRDDNPQTDYYVVDSATKRAVSEVIGYKYD